MVFLLLTEERDSDTIDLQRLKRREENSGNKSRCKQEKMGALIMFQVVKRDGELDEFKLSKITSAIHKACLLYTSDAADE